MTCFPFRRSLALHRGRQPRRRGLTLVELLVVIAIIGVLASLLLAAVQASRESSRRAACQNNLRQVGLGVLNFESTNRKFPPGKKWSGPPNDPKSFAMAWSLLVLGNLEQGAIYDRVDLKLPLTDPKNLPATTQIVPVYLCPSTAKREEHRSVRNKLIGLGSLPGEGLACIDYMGVSGPDKEAKNPATKEAYGRQQGVLIGTRGLPGQDELMEPPAITAGMITDGLSNTICVVECTGRGVGIKNDKIDSLHGAWASGNNVSHLEGSINDKPPKVWYREQIYSDHPGGAHLLMCDGSVHFVTGNVSKSVIRSLCSREGREDLSESPIGR